MLMMARIFSRDVCVAFYIRDMMTKLLTLELSPSKTVVHHTLVAVYCFKPLLCEDLAIEQFFGSRDQCAL